MYHRPRNCCGVCYLKEYTNTHGYPPHHRYPRIHTNTHGILWILTDTHSYPLLPTHTHGYPWIPTDTHGIGYPHIYPQIPTYTHGYLQIPMDYWIPTVTDIPTDTHIYLRYPRIPTQIPTASKSSVVRIGITTSVSYY